MLIRSAPSALDASCDCTCYDQAWCIGAAGVPCTFCDDRAAPVAPLLYFLCAKQMTPIMLVACFWCSFADSECAFCAGCQLRLRMLRSGIMHRGCGRPVRTLRTFSDDRAAPSALQDSQDPYSSSTEPTCAPLSLQLRVGSGSGVKIGQRIDPAHRKNKMRSSCVVFVTAKSKLCDIPYII